MDALPGTRRDDGGVSDESDRCPNCHADVEDAWLACASCGHPLAAEAELPAGALLSAGQFEIVRPIGRGGFGITYEAIDHRLQRRVAVKELFPDSAVRHGSMVLTPPHARPTFRDARARFLREARVLARFTDPGIVRVYEVFEEHNTAYMVMELLDGRNLLELLRARGEPFSEVEVLDVAARAAAALRPVHAAGVLHRDINPSNIILTSDGRIVVIDFGLARSFHTDQSTAFTQVVTPGYAPLEQYLDDARVAPASDVYGLAATLYRLATGRIPVPALERQGGTSLPSPHRLNPAIGKAVSDGLLDALELHVDHRPQSLDAFLRRLGLSHTARSSRSMLIDTMPPPDRPAGAVPPAPEPRPTEPPTELVADDAGRTMPMPAIGATQAAPTAPAGPPQPADPALPVAATQPMAAVPGAEPLAATRPVAAPRPVVVPAPVPPAPTAASPLPAPPPAPSHIALRPPGRWKLTVPLGAAVFAVGSAAPVVTTLALVLLGLPLLATWGDAAVHQARREAGTPHGWLERATPAGAAAPVRFVANLLVSLVRSVPVVALGGALLGLCYGLDRLDAPQALQDGAVRGVGVLITALLVLPARAGSPRFRTGVALDDLTSRLFGQSTRFGQRGVVVWVVAGFVTAAALWFQPELWPFRA